MAMAILAVQVAPALYIDVVAALHKYIIVFLHKEKQTQYGCFGHAIMLLLFINQFAVV